MAVDQTNALSRRSSHRCRAPMHQWILQRSNRLPLVFHLRIPKGLTCQVDVSPIQKECQLHDLHRQACRDWL